MAHEDKKATATANEGTASALEGTLSATSKNMQAIAGQVFDISKQSFEHTTQTLEKLRNARGMDEVVAIQTNFVKEAFEHAAQHARKFSEVIAAFPAVWRAAVFSFRSGTRRAKLQIGEGRSPAFASLSGAGAGCPYAPKSVRNLSVISRDATAPPHSPRRSRSSRSPRRS